VGRVYRGIHEKIAARLRDKYGLKTLIETGTLNGETVEWALQNGFGAVITIELDPGYYRKAQKKYADDTRVEVHHGSSAVILPLILFLEDSPALIWLDAHADQRIDAKHPILDEIAAIAASDVRHIVMVDDAWLFGVGNGWPSFENVIRALQATGRWGYVEEDVIVAEYEEQTNE